MSVATWRLLSAIATPDSIPQVSAESAIGTVFGGVLAIAGVICVLLIIIGGLSYSLSMGDSSKIKKAKDTILYAIVGLVIISLSFLIVQLVVGIF